MITVIYQPPGTDFKASNDAMNELMNALIKGEIFYSIGDYNMVLLN